MAFFDSAITQNLTAGANLVYTVQSEGTLMGFALTNSYYGTVHASAWLQRGGQVIDLGTNVKVSNKTPNDLASGKKIAIFEGDLLYVEPNVAGVISSQISAYMDTGT
jgi:hypothetical protein